MTRPIIHWIYEPVTVVQTRPERLILPDDEPKTFGEKVEQVWRAHKINRETAKQMRRWIKNRTPRRRKAA
jgi:ribosomal protein L3